MLYAPFKKFCISVGIIVSLVLSIGQPSFADEVRVFSASEVRADIEAWMAFLKNTHPKPDYSFDMAEVEKRATELAAGLSGDYGSREVWKQLAVLNPLFADAHVGLRYPVADFEAYKEAGGAVFSLPVRIGEQGGLFVASSISDGSNFKAGDRITHINGVRADEIIGELMERMRGETVRLRRIVAETFFPAFLWTYLGDAKRFDARVEGRGQRAIRLDAMRDTADEKGSKLFSLEIDGDAALLKVSTFKKKHAEAFAEFLKGAFADIKRAGVSRLIIDVSQNGGGARALSDMLLAYLTDKRYTGISAVTARITEQNYPLVKGAFPDKKVGDVVHMPYAQWVQPEAAFENRFDGEIYVMAGPATYSQAIVFATIVQDFKIGRIIGMPTEGRANQSGQVQTYRLPNTGIPVIAPIYVFTRASQDVSGAPVMPELAVDTDAPLKAVEKQIVKVFSP